MQDEVNQEESEEDEVHRKICFIRFVCLSITVGLVRLSADHSNTSKRSRPDLCIVYVCGSSCDRH